MSISYYSKKIVNDNTNIKCLDNKSETDSIMIEFTCATNYDCKSVDVSTFEKDENRHIVITFRGYESQAEVNKILRAFSVMFNTKFISEENTTEFD